MNFNNFYKVNLNKSTLLKIKHKAFKLKIWYRLINIERTIKSVKNENPQKQLVLQISI
jgi:hypothetical protein